MRGIAKIARSDKALKGEMLTLMWHQQALSFAASLAREIP